MIDDRDLTIACIYCIVCTINSKIYIGKTNNLKSRVSSYKSIYKKRKLSSKLEYAIKKYGWHNFNIYAIKTYNIKEQKEMLDFESLLIKELKTQNNKIGYNVLSYSQNRTGIKQIRTKKWNENNGLSHKKRIKQIDLKSGQIINLWESAKDASLFLTGKKYLAVNISRVCNKKPLIDGKGYLYTPKTAGGFYWEFVNNKSKSLYEDTCKKTKKVAQLDINSNNILMIYNSASHAVKMLKLKKAAYIHIQNVCRNYNKTAYGYKWQYV